MKFSVRGYALPTVGGRILALTSLFSAIGTGLFLAGSAVYYVRVVGLTTAQVGTGLSLAAVAGFLSTVPLGSLGDRLGARNMLILIQVWRAACFAALAFVTDLVPFVVVASLQAMATGATGPVSQALVSDVTENDDRSRTLAVLSTIRNVGFSLGALIAAPLLTADNTWTYRAVVLGNVLTFGVSAVLLCRIPASRDHLPSKRDRTLLPVMETFRDWRYLLLTILNTVLLLHMTILAIGLPLWVLEGTNAPRGLIPVLILLNTVLTVLLQVPVARGVELPGAATRALRRGGFLLAACAISAALAGWTDDGRAAAVLIILACIALTLAELWQSAGSWELSHRYAPEGRTSTYLSVFGLSYTGMSIVGPAMIAIVVGTGSAGWLVAALVFTSAAFLAAPATALLDRHRASNDRPEHEQAPSPEVAPERVP
ncbi:MFS transporter [Micromonospora chokoriensis]